MFDFSFTCNLDMYMSAAQAVSLLDKEAADSIARFLLDQFNEDGGFCGRSDESDLYYTVFGMSSLAVLESEFAFDKTINYLAEFGRGEGLDLVHLAALIRCRTLCDFFGGDTRRLCSARAMFAGFENFKNDDSCYSVMPGGRPSLYASFLVYCAGEDCGMGEYSDRDMTDFIKRFKCRDGGYGSIENLASGTTSATAAALILLKRCGCGSDEDAIRWLKARSAGQGGFLAGAHAPIPDLLSTGVSLYALRAVGASVSEKQQVCRAFIDMLWMEDGGFAGSPLDLKTDCEYTFYALLGLGVIADEDNL